MVQFQDICFYTEFPESTNKRQTTLLQEAARLVSIKAHSLSIMLSSCLTAEPATRACSSLVITLPVHEGCSPVDPCTLRSVRKREERQGHHAWQPSGVSKPGNSQSSAQPPLQKPVDKPTQHAIRRQTPHLKRHQQTIITRLGTRHCQAGLVIDIRQTRQTLLKGLFCQYFGNISTRSTSGDSPKRSWRELKISYGLQILVTHMDIHLLPMYLTTLKH